MNTTTNYKGGKVRALGLAALAVLSLAALPAAHAQNPDSDAIAMAPPTMAPPVTPTGSADYAAGPAASQSVYNWHDVPVGQTVKIVRAVFDQGGYQLYDDKGETIVIPFVNQNLYVLRFGESSGDTYFINDGSAPTLYLPRGGYLTNSAAEGSRWYPFGKNFDYTSPVYVGPAPSWDAYINMGWYPDMCYYGGYWGYHPWAFGLSFSPTPGLCFTIGGASFFGWGAYHDFYYAHPYNRVFVHNAVAFNHYNVGRVGAGEFGHYHGGMAYRGGFGHASSALHSGFSGRSYGTEATRGFGGRAMNTTSRTVGTTRAFGGGSSVVSGRSPGAFSGGTRAFSGGARAFGGGSAVRGGARAFGGGTVSRTPSGSFGGGGGHTFSAPSGGGGGGRSFGGGGGGGGRR